ncbi:MAG: hypothetical protein Q8S00_09500 [Deltaproteobacteria bacterium]|nr:hypothetical protein [Deltaproteobacteria bacterium]
MDESLSKHKLELAIDLLADIELSRLSPEQLLLKASRLARIVNRDDISQWLRFELRGYPGDDAVSLKYMNLTGRWTNQSEGKGYWIPLAEIEGHITTGEVQLEQLQVPDVHFAPSSSNPHESVVGIYGQHVMTATQPVTSVLQKMTALANMVADLKGVRSRVLSVLHEFVADAFYLLAFGGVAESIFDQHKALVDEVLQASDSELIQKIPAIYDRLAAGDQEAVSQALSSCRRLIQSFADAKRPAVPDSAAANSQLGPGQYLNRIDAYVQDHCQSDSRRYRLRRALHDVHERASAGVHADVTAMEARSLFLTVYLLLGEIALLGLGAPTQ